MNRIRVLLMAMPPAHRDVFKQVLDDQPDIGIVGEISDPIELLLAVGETGADVVITGMQDSEPPGICSHLLSEYSNIKILAVATDSSKGLIYELRPQKTFLGEVSPQRLPEIIRAAVLNQRV